MFNIHLYAGLALSILILAVGVTGSLIVYKPETERLISSRKAVVEPLGETVPLPLLYRNVSAVRPQDRMDRLYTWGGPAAAWMFRTIRPDGRRQYIYVDQYRGNVQGEYVLDGTVLQWAYELHDNLLLGKRGLVANGYAALLLAVMCITGVAVWWPGAKRVKTGFHYHTRAGWKTQNYDIHKIAGILTMGPLALIAVTGGYYAFPETYRNIAAQLTGTVAYFAPPESHPAGGSEAPLDRVLAVATQTIPDAELTVLTFPATRTAPFTVRKKLPGDWSRLGNQYLYIDRYSGEVLRVDLLRNMPIAVRLIQSMAPLHYGSFGGHWTRVLWILLGLVPGALAITGFLMWWNRVIANKEPPAPAQQTTVHSAVGRLAGLLLLATVCRAQTSATAIIVGGVTDSSGAALTNASIELQDQSRLQTRRQTANEAGQYTITGVVPGTYRIAASATGFRQLIVPSLTIDIAKSYILNFTLELGAITDTIEVKAGAAVELQTLDSTVGSVIKGESLLRMPSINRSAMTFFSLQPLVIPTRGQIALQAGQHLTGQVAGARADQSTFMLDGIDTTDLTAGTNFYVGVATDYNGPTPMIPVPAESVEEFRLSTTNANATYGRSAGGQVSLVTRRGSNDLHGSAYWFVQNDFFNANRWDYNRTGIARQPLRDNRFGASAGGPIRRNRTFFFANYEGRRLPQTAPVARMVPSDSLREGVLRFVDGGGAVRSYTMQSLDPRGLGLSPVVRNFWNRLPKGNDATLGDGLNTVGFRGPADASLHMDFGVFRLDHSFSENWRLNASYRYATEEAAAVTQADIAGFAPGDTPGKAAPGVHTIAEPRSLSLQLTATPTPTILNSLTFGDSRNFWTDRRVPPQPQVPGTSGALAIAENFVSQGLDVSAGAARSRVWNNHQYQLRDDFSWIKGKHNIQLGGGWRHIPVFHQRDDKIVGQLTSLIYFLNARTSVGIPQSSRPATCSASVTANCLRSADVAAWNDLFAGGIGLVDQAGVIATRDASGNPLPLNTPLRSYVHWENFEMYLNDVWRISPSLTLTLGLNYGVQTPPGGKRGSQAILVDQTTQEPLGAQDVFGQRRAAAEQGRVWNPPLAWLPVGKGAPQGVYHTAWDNIGPRIAASWNPAFKDGLFGSILGNQKTVLRAGYGLVYDRINGSTNAFFPMLNVGYAQTLSCLGPRRDGRCQAGSDPTTGFRVGVDGSTVPLSPQLSTSSLVPATGYSETSSFALDPNLRPGYAHTVNFTVQREAPGGFLIEAGYVGHFGRNLLQSVQLNSVPYFMKDSASGQTFAQAFDAVAQHLRAGGAPAQVPVQPWFENQMKGAPACAASCTAGLAGSQNASFTQGLVNTLFNVINTQRPAGPITNNQVFDLWMRANGGLSNYNAGFLSVQRRFSSGFGFQANYTVSRMLDYHGYNQEAESLISNGFDYRLDYAPDSADRTHVFNSNFFYELPFGHRQGWPAYFLGGWYVSGIYTANSGLPLTVVESTSAWGGSQQVGSISAGAIPIGKLDSGNGVNGRVAGSNGVGTSGDPARGGSGLNLFANPEAVFNNFRPILLSVDGRNGRNRVRGLSHWNVDLSVGKKTRISESSQAVFTFDLINALNHVEFVDPVLSLQSRAGFGVLNTQYGTPRAIQLGLRFEF